MKIGQCITIKTGNGIVVETLTDSAIVAVKINGIWGFHTLPIEREKSKPRCYGCADAGVIISNRTGSDNMDVTLIVDPCDSCDAYKGVDADIFGSYTDSLPQPVEDELARLGIEP